MYDTNAITPALIVDRIEGLQRERTFSVKGKLLSERLVDKNGRIKKGCLFDSTGTNSKRGSERKSRSIERLGEVPCEEKVG